MRALDIVTPGSQAAMPRCSCGQGSGAVPREDDGAPASSPVSPVAANLPNGWRMLRLKYCLSAVSQGWSPQCEDIEAGEREWGVLKAGCVNHGVFRSSENKRLPADVEPPVDFEVVPGDLLVSRANTRQLLGSAALVTPSSARLLLCDKLYRLVTKVDVLDQRYLARVFASAWVRYQLERDATGTSDSMQNTSQQSIRELELPIPQPKDQRVIADFLDRETEVIDALVASKQRLIGLLQEKRTALISRAVTRGLDPNVLMKDSDVAWFGSLPRRWPVFPLMRLVDLKRPIMYGIVLPGPDFPGGVPIVKGGDVSPERLVLDQLNRTDPVIESRYVRSRLAGGDIVYAIRGSIGAAAVVPCALEGANLTQDTARVAPRDGVDVGWLKYALQSSPVFAQLEAGAVGATIRGINIFSLKRAVLPVPPHGEQVAIRQHLDLQTRQLDDLNGSACEALERLHEYRSALITAAVTGRIDVRTYRGEAS